MSQRVYNFSAGPAMLPLPVLEQVQRDLLSLPGLGMSVLEISHRSPAFGEILSAAEANLRKLLCVPDQYKVIFLQGGSRLQFSMIPMNIIRGCDRSADYLVTGFWGQKAIVEARLEGKVRVAYDGESHNFSRLPRAGELDLDPRAVYVYYTSNETIQGVQFQTEPNSGDVPLVCDASSDFLSRPIDVPRHGLIYACAQKNAGPAGVTAVILREDMLEHVSDGLPSMLDYRNHIKNGSLYNTPPVFAIYVMNLVAEWLLKEVGGLEAMAERNQEKADLLYDVIDASNGFYIGHAETDCRSKMNVTFRTTSDELDKTFLAEAQKQGLCTLKGHRSVGGVRASIYNAMPREGVFALAQFMQKFQTNHSG